MQNSLLALIAALLLGACAPREAAWSETQSPKLNTVEVVRLSHDLRVPASGRPEGADLAELGAFLARHDIGPDDEVSLFGARVETTARYLRERGIAAQWFSAESQPFDNVRVVVVRHVVTPPNCPDWRKPATSDYANTPMSNLGCANIANLGLMIANPRDLVQGRAPGDADGAVSAAAVQRYRTDKVKALEKTSTSQ